MAPVARRLDELPEELVSNISLRLQVDDIAAFRLTCRAIEHKTFHEFATEYFSTKAFIITTDSLKVLTGISHSEKLRGFLHHIHFITAFFSTTAFGCPNGCNCAWQPSVKQREAYRTYIDDQKLLAKTGQDKDMLVDAFANLPNLESLYIDDSPGAIRPEVDFRGRNKVPRVTGRAPSFAPEAGKDDEYAKVLHHVWKIVTESIAQAKISTITHFGTQFLRSSNGLSVSPDLAFNKETLAGLTTAFKGLQKLHLRIKSPQNADNLESGVKPSSLTRTKKVCTKLASVLPSLELLNISFDSLGDTGVVFEAFSENLDFSKMTKLCLDGLCIDAGPLATVIYKLDSIEDLRLVFMNLTKGSWVTILKVIQKHTDQLTHLHLMYLLEAGRKAFFLKPREHANIPGPFFDDEFDDEVDDEMDDSEYESDDDYSDDDMPSLEPADETTAEGAAVGQTEDSHSLGDEHDEDNNEMDEEKDEEEESQEGGDEDDYVTTEDDDFNDSGEPMPPSQETQAAENPPQTDGEGQSAANQQHTGHSVNDHSAPDDPGSGERGYFVCLQGEQIAIQLPIFIEEYNLGDEVDEEPLLPPGLPGNINNFNNFFNMMMNGPNGPNGPPPAGGTALGGMGGGIPPGAIALGAIPIAAYPAGAAPAGATLLATTPAGTYPANAIPLAAYSANAIPTGAGGGTFPPGIASGTPATGATGGIGVTNGVAGATNNANQASVGAEDDNDESGW